jgi:hypothetical protein
MKDKMIDTRIEPILIITGAATAVALVQFLAPSQVLRLVYGEAPTDAISLGLARHWGLLIFCVGVLLIYAAFHPPLRDSTMVFGAAEKVALGSGVLGTSLRRHRVAAAIAAGDSVIALIYIAYLAGF